MKIVFVSACFICTNLNFSRCLGFHCADHDFVSGGDLLSDDIACGSQLCDAFWKVPRDSLFTH